MALAVSVVCGFCSAGGMEQGGCWPEHIAGTSSRQVERRSHRNQRRRRLLGRDALTLDSLHRPLKLPFYSNHLCFGEAICYHFCGQ